MIVVDSLQCMTMQESAWIMPSKMKSEAACAGDSLRMGDACEAVC